MPYYRAPGPTAGAATLKRWFRQFVEMRDVEGAERWILSAVEAGADMLFAAATDHLYIDTGHPLDLRTRHSRRSTLMAGATPRSSWPAWCQPTPEAERAEESNSWRHPVDLVDILDRAFEELPGALQAGRGRRDGSGHLAAHAPTMRAQGQTYRIAQRMHRGEKLFEDE